MESLDPVNSLDYLQVLQHRFKRLLIQQWNNGSALSARMLFYLSGGQETGKLFGVA